MEVGQRYLRDQAIELVKEIAASDKATAEFKAAADKFLETKDDTKANVEPTTALIAELEKQQQPDVRNLKKYLLRRITSERNLYGSSVVTDGHMISVSVD